MLPPGNTSGGCECPHRGGERACRRSPHRHAPANVAVSPPSNCPQYSPHRSGDSHMEGLYAKAYSHATKRPLPRRRPLLQRPHCLHHHSTALSHAGALQCIPHVVQTHGHGRAREGCLARGAGKAVEGRLRDSDLVPPQAAAAAGASELLQTLWRHAAPDPQLSRAALARCLCQAASPPGLRALTGPAGGDGGAGAPPRRAARTAAWRARRARTRRCSAPRTPGGPRARARQCAPRRPRRSR